MAWCKRTGNRFAILVYEAISMNDVFLFVELQRRLVSAFAKLYPNAKDLKWLLDFPQSGKR